MTLFGLLFAGGCYQAGAPENPSRPTAALEAFEAAEKALRAGKVDVALAQAEAAVAADPTFDEAAWLQASLLGRAGRVDEALAICEAITARSPDLVQAHLLQGILWDQSGNLDAANRSYDEVLRRYRALDESGRAGHRDQLLYAVVTFLRHGELDGVKSVNAFLERFPDHASALYIKACMQQKERGFLLRWFSESNDGATLPGALPESAPNDSPSETGPAGTPPGDPGAEKE